MGCVYMATNTENGKPYIGMTIRSIAKRRTEHINSARNNSLCVFHKAIRKYGKEAFTWEPLFTSKDADTLFNVEQKYIDYYNSVEWGYNQCYGGRGVIPTDAIRLQKSKSTTLLHKDPIYKKNRMAGIKAYWDTEEAHDWARERARKLALDPKWKEACRLSYTDQRREDASKRLTERMKYVKKNDPSFFARRALKLTDAGREKMSITGRQQWASKTEEQKHIVVEKLYETMQTDKWKKATKDGSKKRRVPVVCVETGIVYASAEEAANAIGSTRRNVNAVICKRQHTTKGFSFVRANKENT